MNFARRDPVGARTGGCEPGLTCANCAFLNRTFTLLSPVKLKDNIVTMVTGRIVCCSCSKSAAAVYGLLAASNSQIVLSVRKTTKSDELYNVLTSYLRYSVYRYVNSSYNMDVKFYFVFVSLLSGLAMIKCNRG